jgi:ribosomal protein S18 acetylase RimI-like enzyme
VFAGAIACYSAAFSLPPYDDPLRGIDVRRRLLGEHRYRRELKTLCAVIPGNEVVGMSYGFRTAPGQAFYDRVSEHAGKALAKEWMASSYEVAEVAVAPEYQGCGIGAGLVTELLSRRPERTAVLSTRTDSRAHELYRRLGFEVITTMQFADDGALFFIMGRRLQD